MIITDMEMSDQILHAAAYCAGLSIEDLLLRTRIKVYAKYRHAAARLIHEAGYAYAEIGRAMNRHHASAMHSCCWLNGKALRETLSAVEMVRAKIGMVQVPRKSAAPLKIVRINKTESHPEVSVRRAIVAPFPPGADKYILAGLPRKQLKAAFPEWRI